MAFTEYNFDYTAEGAGALGAGTMIPGLIGLVLGIIVMWKIFSKAGEAGWKSLIPFYNTYTEFKLFWAGCNPLLMTILLLVPIVNCILAFILIYKMCKSFGKGVGFFILTLFFAPITLLILAFGGAQYEGPQ